MIASLVERSGKRPTETATYTECGTTPENHLSRVTLPAHLQSRRLEHDPAAWRKNQLSSTTMPERTA